MSNIAARRREIEKRRRVEREHLLKDHNEKFGAEMAALRADCAKEGHVRGRFWDNGLGWTWFYCAKCDAVMDQQKHEIGGDA